MGAMQIPAEPQPRETLSHRKLGPLTPLAQTRTLPKRHLLAEFWSFTREGEQGWKVKDLGCTSKEEERRQGCRCRRAGQADQLFTMVPASTLSTHQLQIRRPRDIKEPYLRSGEEGGLHDAASPRRRLIIRVVEPADQNRPQPALAERTPLPRQGAAAQPDKILR